MFQDELRKDAQARQARAGLPVGLDCESAKPLGAQLRNVPTPTSAGSASDEYNKAMDAFRHHEDLRRDVGNALAELYQTLSEARYLSHDPAAVPPSPMDKQATEEPTPNSGLGAQFRGFRDLAVASNRDLSDMAGFIRRLTNALDR